MMDAPRALATVSDYDGFQAALRARVDDLGLTMAQIDELAGFHPGYAGKLLGPAQIKAIGRMSLGAILGVLGLSLVVVEDPAKLARVLPRFERKRRAGRNASKEARIGKSTMARVFSPVVRELLKRAREARSAKLSPKQRRRIAQKAARARWLDGRKRWRRKRHRQAKAQPSARELVPA